VGTVLSIVPTGIVPNTVACAIEPASVVLATVRVVKGIASVVVSAGRSTMLQIVVWQTVDGLRPASLTWTTLPGANLLLVCLGICFKIEVSCREFLIPI